MRSRPQGRGRGTARSPIPLHTFSGVPDVRPATYHFSTDDGLGLSLFRFRRKACDDPVLIVHGLTTSTDMFIMPEHYNLVSYLLDHGFTDIWCLDNRMSNRHVYNHWPHRFTMDDVALFDFPPALAVIRGEVGDRPIHVISHCLGAVSFTMSVAAGVVDGIASLVVNSAGLMPRVPPWSLAKLTVAPFAMEYVLGIPTLDPRCSLEPGINKRKLLGLATSWTHPECREPACNMLSLMWGSGHPALYHHRNLHDITHARSGDLYGVTGLNYYRHVRRMVRAGRAVKFDRNDSRYSRLPDDYLARSADIRTPMLLLTGADNRVFADSNIQFHDFLASAAPGLHELQVVPGYGHQDVFMGRDSAIDVFPRIADFIEDHRVGRKSHSKGPLVATSVPAI